MKNNRNRRKNGDGSWGKRKINGINYVYLTKTYDFLDSPKTFYGKTEAEVKQKQKKFEEETVHLNKNEIPKETFYDYISYWLVNEKKNEIKAKTYDGYEQYINLYVKGTPLGNLQMTNINNKDIFTRHMNKMAEDYSRNTIERTYAVIKQCLDYAVDNRHIKENYARKIKLVSEDKVKVKKKDIQFLDEEDMEKLYQECHRIASKENPINGIKNGKNVYGKNAYVVVLIMYTGMRISECCGLKWKDIDDNFIKINETKILVRDRDENSKNNYKEVVSTTKSASSTRLIPLCDRSREMLNLLKEHSDCKPESYIANGVRSNITRTLHSMLKRANCNTQSCGVHALRHSFATELFNQGLDVKTVSDILGHSDTRVTSQIYIHVLNKKKLEAVNIFNNSKTITENKINDEILNILSENGIFLSEIENGVLGYIKDKKIHKLTFTDTVEINNTIIQARDIYNSYYSKT